MNNNRPRFRGLLLLSPTGMFLIVLLQFFIGQDLILLAKEGAVPVVVKKVAKSGGLMRDVSLTGTVRSLRRSRLSSRTEGLVETLNVDAGSVVKKGETLMNLDTRLAEIELELIRAEIEEAEIELSEAKRLAEEVRELSESGAFAKSAAKSREAAIRLSSTKISQLKVREKQQAEMVERHQLIAPYDGVIYKKLSEAGEWVTTGTPVLELVDTKDLVFDVQAPQELLGAIHKAQDSEVTLEAYPNHPFQAEISVAVPVKDLVTRTFLVRLKLEDPEGKASPGMSGRVVIRYPALEGEGVRIPRDAVVRSSDGISRVWLVVPSKDGGSVVQSREVKTAGELGVYTDVIKGLEGGETLVVKGNEGLQENQSVEVRGEDKRNLPNP